MPGADQHSEEDTYNSEAGKVPWAGRNAKLRLIRTIRKTLMSIGYPRQAERG